MIYKLLSLAALTSIIIVVIFSYKPFSRKSNEYKQTTNSEQPENINNFPEIDPDNPPRFIQADFVELDKVLSISKFRSGMGHDFSANSGETCRSLKHYFDTMDPSQPNYKYEGLPRSSYPSPRLNQDVKIFSPVDGTLKLMSYDEIGFNNELQVIPDAYPNVVIRLMHVQAVPGIKDGPVKAGQVIGLVLANQSFDIAIGSDQKGAYKTGFISYFAALPDEIFAKYRERGVKSRDDLIISRSFRDANPFSCHDKEVFDKDYPSLQGWSNHVVRLSGFEDIEAAIQVKYPNPIIFQDQDSNPTRK